MSLRNSTLSGNLRLGAPGGDGVTTFSGGLGGGILNVFGASMTVDNCTLIGNKAIGGDHSTPTLANNVTGDGLGGGTENAPNATMTIIDKQRNGDLDGDGATDAGPGGIGGGGSIDLI